MSVQIVHAADLHLDRNFRIANLTRRDRRKEDLKSNFERIADYVIENEPDLFLLAGDVFDRINPGNSARELLVRKLKEVSVAGVKVFVIGGNHDVPKLRRGPGTLAIDVLEAAGIARVFGQSDRFVSATLKIDGKPVTVAGRSFFAEREEMNPFGDSLSPKGRHNIVLVHGSLQAGDVMPNDLSFIRQHPFSAQDIPPEVSYVALGHYHNPFVRVRDQTWIVNPGSIERLTWADADDNKGFVWAEITQEGVEVEQIKLPTRPMRALELTLGKDDGRDLTELVVSYLREDPDPDAIARLSLNGLIRPEQHRSLQVREVYQEASDLFFHFTLDQTRLEVEGFGRVFLSRVDSPREAFEKRLERLIEERPEEKDFLTRVKDLGLEYLRGGR
ncbi:MAG: exonuclease SbcCD subunit D [Thermoplasmata archaeon]